MFSNYNRKVISLSTFRHKYSKSPTKPKKSKNMEIENFSRKKADLLVFWTQIFNKKKRDKMKDSKSKLLEI